MKFKKLPVWLRGGIIGAIVAIIGILLSLGLSQIINTNESPTILHAILVVFAIPFQAISILFTLLGIWGCNFKADPCYAEMFTGHIITTAMFFGLGAYLAWMKSKKKLKYGILSLILFIILCIAIFLIVIH